MSLPLWSQRFKDQIQGLPESSSNSMDLLEQALTEKLISKEDYLNWAREAFELPTLQNDFFITGDWNRDTFMQLKDSFAWSHLCFPVAQWNTHPIIACIHPQENLPANSILVLADFSALKKAWDALQIQILLASASAEPEPLTEVTPEPEQGLGFAALVTATPAPTKKPSVPVPQTAAESTVHEHESAIEISLNLSAIQNSDGMSMDDFEKAMSSSLLEEAGVKPEGDASAAPVEEEKIEGFDFGGGTPQAAAPMDLKSLSVRSQDEAANATNPTPKIQPTPVVVQAPTAKAQPAPVIPAARIPEPMLAPTPSLESADLKSVPTGAADLKRWSEQNSTLLKAKSEIAFHEMKRHFIKSMILSVSADGKHVEPILWDENFKPSLDPNPFLLGIPSIFNIVTTTQKPYHGYVISNQINESFFAQRNGGLLAEHVTIAPIIIEDHVIGMILGISTKQAYTKQALQNVELQSRRLIENLAS